MKDEIKEILELFENTDENIMFGDIVELNSKQSHLLLDYITNLQERNKKAIEYINKFWEKKSYYEDVDNCMKYATMNEWNKSDLLNILQGEDKDE